MSVVVAKRYAKSIFDLCQEKDSLERTYKEINILIQVFKNNKTILDFLINPVISFSQKKDFFDKGLKDKLDSLTMSILYFVIRNKRANISLPIIRENNQMDFFEWKNNDPLKINKYGIAEPISAKKIYPDIIFVPLVAYDDHLNRLGYGGGFYDRYLKKIAKIKKILKIGLGFSYQELKKIPINKYDKKLDLIITEKKIIQ